MRTGLETHSYSDSDELIDIKIGGSTVKSFGYDAAGRTTGITYSGATTALAYDYESRITSISRSGVTTNTFTYNGLDTRVGKVDSGGTKTYKRDGAYVTDPVLSDGAANYTPGISEKRSGTTKYNNADFLGSFTRQTDTNQATSGTRSYDAFGLPTGTTLSPTGPFGFAAGWGYQEDGDYGVKLLGHRYYDPSIGRFLTRDPVEDGRNWYVYCESDPLSLIDPDGLQGNEWKKGPGGTRYRTDLSQKPKPNMHIKHPDGKESVISDKGGERRSHGGNPTTKLPKDLRKGYRPIIRKFVRGAAKRVPIVFLVLTLAEIVEGSMGGGEGAGAGESGFQNGKAGAGFAGGGGRSW
ncbi:MAG: RHS repeat-associated core domain-containing protein [Fimbriimonadaceae bacterium]